MDARLLILTVPSALILAGLVWHSFQAMERRRAVAFWISVFVYGVLRGLGVKWVTKTIGASFPYAVHNPAFTIYGVSAQEIAGWAVVTYLGWWAGARLSRHLFVQIAWASLFLGAISWVIEAAAIAARWWHWTVPTASRVFMNVPAIGIVDWFFVGIDFLLPFAVITRGGQAPSPVRTGEGARPPLAAWSLLLFPIHFGAHLLPGIWLHVVHWILVLLLAWLAFTSDREDHPFNSALKWIPSAGFLLIVLDVALVEIFVVKRPELLVSTIPALIIWLAPPLKVRRKQLAAPVLILIVLFAMVLHWKSATDRKDMTRRVDAAIAERNRGRLAEAVAQLESVSRDHPTSYIAHALAGEIRYRTKQLDGAYKDFARAVEIKQDFIRGYRFLAVIDLQHGRTTEARKWAELGLEIQPEDIQLRYLAGKDYVIDTPETARGMAALAYEVGDRATAERLMRQSSPRNN